MNSIHVVRNVIEAWKHREEGFLYVEEVEFAEPCAVCSIVTTQFSPEGIRTMTTVRGRKVESRMSDRAGDNFSSKNLRVDSFPAGGDAFRGVEVKSTTLQSQRKSIEEDTAHPSTSTSKVSWVSMPRSLLNRSIAPILSIKRVRLTKSSTGQLLVFLLKLAALEAVRRGTKKKCPQIWWGLQGITLFQTPPFSWFQRFGPVRQLVRNTQSFSKPLFILSLATAVTGAVEEIQQASKQNLLERVLAPEATENTRSNADTKVSGSSRLQTLNRLKQELAKAEIELPERITDEELQRFLVAANGNLPKFISSIRKTVGWRQSYYFLNEQELRTWSTLIFWHNRDKMSRPVLVVRLGLAYTILPAEDRPRFCQAVVSQVEYGILNLLHEEPKITVILDCKGTTSVGFPVAMMKSCSVIVQEHFPTRLAALFAVNLPPDAKVIANAIIQVVRPVTRGKVTFLGDIFLEPVSEFLGGTEKVPSSLGGSCHCAKCSEDRKSEGVPQTPPDRGTLGRSRVVKEAQEEEKQEEAAEEESGLFRHEGYWKMNNTTEVAVWTLQDSASAVLIHRPCHRRLDGRGRKLGDETEEWMKNPWLLRSGKICNRVQPMLPKWTQVFCI
ncbi:hypothetical protein R1flu_021371 [Riccia fluitans]|uniref:CRAL-TRIO domain-containing protein n=1 Tax=Riccia fluitans TaxID=41844 RepID=A0ABD1ZP55_9MARC